MNNCSLVILSCDSYSDIWDTFFKLKDKYWKDCTYETYLLTETKKCDYCNTINVDLPIELWTSRIRKSLEQIKTDYVLLMIDDFFIRNKVNQERIDYILDNFSDNTAFFNFEQEYDTNNIECGLNGFKKRINGICKISCQAGIWDRKKLINLLNVSCTPWEWERLNIALDYDYYINSSDLIIDYGFKVGDFSLVGGKWSKEIIPFFEKEKISIDLTKRGFFLDSDQFSIVIPNYNNEEWLEKCINSLKQQTYKNWKVYIIDDQSTDNSMSIIKSCTKGINAEIVENEIKLYNGGSRNVGILKAKNDNHNGYLIFIDSDDWLANDRVLENIHNFLIKNNKPDLITLGYRAKDGNNILNTAYSKFNSKFELFKADTICCAVWAKCFKVSIAPLFEYNTLMEDRNYHYRLVYNCNTMLPFGEITHIWNKSNKKSITTNKNQLYDSKMQAIMDWDSCAYRHIAGMICILKELKEQEYIDYIKYKISECKKRIDKGIYQQF